MKNLKPQVCHSIGDTRLSDCELLTINNDLNVIYCVNNKHELICVNTDNDCVRNCGQLIVNESESDSVVNAIDVQYMCEEKCVFVVFSNACLVSYNTISETQHSFKLLSNHIQCSAFSSDQELIVLLTDNYDLVLINKLLDISAKTHLNADHFGLNEAVTVNWGSKHTQFHGKGIKPHHTVQNIVVEDISDDLRTRISWRGDDLYFVTSSIDSLSKYRKLRIWNREAVLCYTSELVSGLGSLISWRPSGNIIASSQQLPNKYNIVFFEKNGLRHGEFELPFTPNSFQIHDILWSHDSEVLLILGDESIENCSNQILMLWWQNNYHWYLKQKLIYNNKKVVKLLWGQFGKLTLFILFNNGELVEYRWKWCIDESNGNVAVIDANQLNLSNFNTTVIPPPFYGYSFNFNHQIIQICFSKCSKYFVVILNNDNILFYQNDINSYKSEHMSHLYDINEMNSHPEYECIYAYKFEGISSLTEIVLAQNFLLFGVDLDNYLTCFDCKNNTRELIQLFQLTGKILAINCISNIVGIGKNDGTLWKYDYERNSCEPWVDHCNIPIRYPQNCCQLKLVEIDNKCYSLSLCEDFTLYMDNCIISKNNCNSFIIINEQFLVYSTLDHLLQYFPLNNLNIIKNHIIEQNFQRSIEKGAKIITFSTNDAKLIVEMPRGNLETIYPRPILLNVVISKLKELKFDIAFELLRKHRINLNIMYDYDPNHFNDNIQLFIEQIAKINLDWICLFLTDLTNEDFYIKLCNITNNNSNSNNRNMINKVDNICESMRHIMNKLDPFKYLHPILLTFIKKTKPEFETALITIKQFDDNLIRDKALKFLLYSIDVNILFDEALGTYDMQIAHMVATRSQRDPKEYSALIERFNSFNHENYKRYQIDIYLKRYKNALINISKCEDHFDECLELIQNHKLYRDAITIFESSSNEHKNIIWKMYAQYLFNKRYFDESAIAYKRCNDLVNAIKCYQLSGNWNAAIASAFKCKDIDIKIVARNLAKNLSSNGQFCDSAYLLQHYADDPNEAIRVLISGHEWQHALRLLSQYSDESLNQLLHNQLNNDYESILDTISCYISDLLKYKNRLNTVRLTLNRMNDETEFNTAFDDYSDTSSLVESNIESKLSTNSLSTKASKRNSKKIEKKKYVWKDGSVDEDLQLIFLITEIIQDSDRIQDEVALLITVLFDLDYTENASNIQRKFSDLLEMIDSTIKDIWIENEISKENQFSYQSKKAFITDFKNIPKLRKINWKLALL